jgi:LemA protein
MWIALAVVGGIVVLLVSVMVMYNRFVTQRNLVRESWRQVDVELQRRYDLIPNLIETVKGYAAHERGVLEAVTEARTNAQRVHAAGGGPTPAQQAVAEGALSTALSRLLVTVEAYPDLKANQNFLMLQQQLAETEDRVAAGRRFYNGNVRALNTRVESFPSNVIAGMFGFHREEYFEANDPAVRAAPRVDFSGLGSGGPGSTGVPPGGAQGAVPGAQQGTALPPALGQYPPAQQPYPGQPPNPGQPPYSSPQG